MDDCDDIEVVGGGGLLVPRERSESDPISEGAGEWGGVLSSPASSVSVDAGRFPPRPR
jgi:hypothetical protein